MKLKYWTVYGCSGEDNIEGALSQVVPIPEMDRAVQMDEFVAQVMADAFDGTSVRYGVSVIGWASADRVPAVTWLTENIKRYRHGLFIRFNCEFIQFSFDHPSGSEYKVFYIRGAGYVPNASSVQASYMKYSLIVRQEESRRFADFFAKHFLDSIHSSGSDFGALCTVNATSLYRVRKISSQIDSLCRTALGTTSLP